MYERLFQESQLDILTLRPSKLKEHECVPEQRDPQKMLPQTKGTEGTCVPVVKLERKRYPAPCRGKKKLKSLGKLSSRWLVFSF